ncbi:multidrug effflux MFS transporter [Craurococcus roseus]|uniref:multidrug effflux MFS transporter n=1 Tax=Craurococcus roseus TaxID=77585 RepID=UPI0031D71274
MSPRDASEGAVAAAQVRPKPSLFLLVAMTGLGPFTMQIVIPSMPVMAAALAVPYGTVQLTLTLYLIGVALGQLLYGPLSDRYGRKPLLLAGLGFYLLGSAAAAAAPTAGVLIVARVLQAAGGCAGLVLGRAMVRDAYPREQAASVIGYVSTAMSVAPMVSPLLGSVLTEHFGWRSTMLACLLIGAPLWLAMRWRLPETLAQPAPLPGVAGMLGAYAQLLRLPAFRAYCGVVSLSTGVFFAFASGTPVVVVNGMGHPPTHLAAAMMLLALSWSAGTFTTARLSVRLGVSRLLRLGTGLILAGGVLAVLLLVFAPPNIFLFFLPMMVMAFGNGVAQPSAIAAAVSVRPGLAGTASGLVGALQMGFGALMTVAAGATEDGSGGATVACMVLCAVGTQAFLRGVPKRG